MGIFGKDKGSGDEDGVTAPVAAPLAVDDLKPADYNPRTITPEQLADLQKAMVEFGDLSGIVFNVRTGNLVGGHQRVKHLPQDAEVEIIQRYAEPTAQHTIAHGYIVMDGERWQYREIDAPVEVEKLMNVSANQQGGEFDDALLATVAKDLYDAGRLDYSLLGFSEQAITKLWTDHDIQMPGGDMDLGYEQDSSDGFAEGDQFGEDREHIFEMIMPSGHERLAEFKTLLSDMAADWKVDYRVRVVRK